MSGNGRYLGFRVAPTGRPVHVNDTGWLDTVLRVTHADVESGATTITDTSALGAGQFSIIADGVGPDHALKKLQAGTGASIADNGDRLLLTVTGGTRDICLSTGPPLTTSSVLFTTAINFIFPGTARTGPPTAISAIVGIAGNPGTVEVDIIDVTNGAAQIAGPDSASNAAPLIMPLTYTGAASATPATWRVRFRRLAAPAPVSFGGVTVFF